MGEPKWFYWNEPDQVGPFSKDELTSLYAKGVISEATLVAMERSSEWLPLDTILQQASRAPPPPLKANQKYPQGRHWYRHLGSTISFIVGVLSFAGATAQIAQGSGWKGGLVGGPVMILGAIAYRSAKKRKLGEVRPTILRTVVEVALLLLICLIVLAQNNLKYQIATDPVPNVLIPLWAVLAYLAVNLMPKKSSKPTRVV